MFGLAKSEAAARGLRMCRHSIDTAWFGIGKVNMCAAASGTKTNKHLGDLSRWFKKSKVSETIFFCTDNVMDK